ncbi:hypothetical protein MNV49_001926 [Pseudohyphozyma bogoriensis]|nr:hypothetical protein MNV49_001926 [Pseudohyphozyma bogoriensis]
MSRRDPPQSAHSGGSPNPAWSQHAPPAQNPWGQQTHPQLDTIPFNWQIPPPLHPSLYGYPQAQSRLPGYAPPYPQVAPDSPVVKSQINLLLATQDHRFKLRDLRDGAGTLHDLSAVQGLGGPQCFETEGGFFVCLHGYALVTNIGRTEPCEIHVSEGSSSPNPPNKWTQPTPIYSAFNMNGEFRMIFGYQWDVDGRSVKFIRMQDYMNWKNAVKFKTVRMGMPVQPNPGAMELGSMLGRVARKGACTSLNVLNSFKALRPPTHTRKRRAAVAAVEDKKGLSSADRHRRRLVKAQLVNWVVWISYCLVEKLADRTVAYVIPLYEEIKLVLLCSILISRSTGSEIIFKNIIKPFLSPYERPLDAIGFVVGEVLELGLWLLLWVPKAIWARIGSQGGSGKNVVDDIPNILKGLRAEGRPPVAKQLAERIEEAGTRLPPTRGPKKSAEADAGPSMSVGVGRVPVRRVVSGGASGTVGVGQQKRVPSGSGRAALTSATSTNGSTTTQAPTLRKSSSKSPPLRSPTAPSPDGSPEAHHASIPGLLFGSTGSASSGGPPAGAAGQEEGTMLSPKRKALDALAGLSRELMGEEEGWTLGGMGSGGAAKRRKVALGDGVGKASTCVELDYECSYETSKGPGPVNVVVTRDYLAALEARISKLEDTEAARSGTTPSDAFAGFGARNNPTPRASGSISSQPDHLLEHSPSLPITQTSPPDINTTAALPNSASSPSWKNFTNSTAGVSFHSLLLKTFFSSPRVAPPPTSGPPPVRQQLADTNPLRLGLIEISDLPTEREADILFDFYFSHTQRLYPLLHEKSVRDSYKSFLRNADTYPGSWSGTTILTQAALYFVMFAMSLRVGGKGGSSPKEKNYYEKSKMLLEYRPPLPQDFRHIQVLLLRALYTQNNEDPGECWHLTGLAVRAAYGMGLHRDTPRPNDDVLEREQRRRTWWGCVAVDGLMTLTLDRPSALSTSTSGFPLPLPMPEELPALSEFFRYSIGLYQVLSNVPSGMNSNISTFSLLHEHQSATIPSATTLISKLEDRWNNWTESIPSYLKVSSDNTWQTTEAVVLALRAMSIRLLIHRPFLHNAINGEMESGNLEFKESTGNSLAIIVETSVKVIYLLVASEGSDQLSAPWYRLFYALNSCMSLAAVATLDTALWSAYTTTDVSKVAINQALQTVRGLINTLAGDGLISAVRSVPIVDQILTAPAISRMGSPAPEPPYAAAAPELDLDALPYMDWDHLFQGVDTGSVFNFLGSEVDARNMTPLEVTAWAGGM